MGGMKLWNRFLSLCMTWFFVFLSAMNSSAGAAQPCPAYYSPDDDKIFWFIHISDIHIGARGSQDSQNLQWIVDSGASIIDPCFIVASGDLTDSTNGNILGWPNGPYQEEWNEYRSILNSAGIDAGFYYDLPGNHEHYNDQYFTYYLANSIQGQETGQTQIVWNRQFDFGKYLFLGVNTSDNTGSSFSIFWPWGDYAGLDENELAFINDELQQNQDADLTFIFGHHPVTDTGASDDTWLYYGAPEFISLLDTYGASFYGYGHTHSLNKDIFSGDEYTGQMTGAGVYYFNIASLGKSTEDQYSIIAVDCNGIAICTQNINTWPVVLITAPLNKIFGSEENPFGYDVPLSNENPIRALVFDSTPIINVQYRIDGSGVWHPMSISPGNPHLWEGLWDASVLSEGNHSIEVQASSSSGTQMDIITVLAVSSPLSIPAVSESCMLIFFILLVGSALLVMRRRTRQESV